MSKIEETLKKIAADISRGSSQSTSSTDSRPLARTHDLPGDPDCPICHGMGYLRVDVPLGHPDFGKLEICTCRAKQISGQVRERLFTLSNLEELKHMTFDNFKPRGRVGEGRMQADSLERACNQAMIFAQKLEGWLLIQGNYGCGKTHLAAAIANFAVNLGVPTLFITVPDLLDMLRFAYDDPEATFQQRFEEIRNSRLLIMDDFGTQNATSWAQEKLFQIINYRYINHLPTVITTNLLLDQIDERISSRFQDPALVTKVYIQANDYRRPHEDSGMPELSSLDLLHNRTLENFDLRKHENISQEELASLENAFLAARKYAEHPHGWIVFTGPYGVGKTHLAAAIANACRDRLQRPPLFVVVPDLLDYLRATFSPNSNASYDMRFEEVRASPLLVLDDLGTQSMTPWVKEKLYQLFNHRYNAELPTVITTSDKIKDMDPRLRSRMIDQRFCDIYAIMAPPYEGTVKKNPRLANRRRIGK